MLIEDNIYKKVLPKLIDLLLMSIRRPISCKDATYNMRYDFSIEMVHN